MTARFRLAILATAVATALAEHAKGTVTVDEFSLPRIVDGFDVLLKVDKSYSYGDNHDAFKEFAKQYSEQASNGKVRKDFIVATIPVESYGDKENQEYVKKTFGAEDEDKFPEYFYIEKGKDPKKAVKFEGSDKGIDSITTFVKTQAGVRIGTGGTLEDMDKIAAKFVLAGDEKEKEALVKEATKTADKYKDDEKTIAETYLKVLSKAMTKGVEYFETETNRVKKMLGEGKSNMKKEKRTLFEDKLKVLASFTNPIPKDEL